MSEDLGTYTYTARNANNPEKVVTFTLDNGHMRVNLTGILEQTGKVIEANEKPEEFKTQVASQVKPTVIKMVENIAGPVHISDVKAKLNDEESLTVSLWQRIGGLRLVPVRFNMGQVDNIDSAKAFVRELKTRQSSSEDIHKFFGPLDYWLGWIGLGLLLVFLLRRPRKNT